jgi:RNAse (barnase) inhibitor barstar
MTQLTDILDDPEYNGVYRIEGAVLPLPELLCLDARGIAGKTALLESIGQILDFPDYYGANWDALEECLFDLSWWEGPVCLLIEHADRLGNGDLELLADVWGEAAGAWGVAGRVCVLILQGAGLPNLPAIE